MLHQRQTYLILILLKGNKIKWGSEKANSLVKLCTNTSMLKTKQKLHVGIFSAKHIQHKQVHTGCHTEYFVLGFTQQTQN